MEGRLSDQTLKEAREDIKDALLTDRMWLAEEHDRMRIYGESLCKAPPGRDPEELEKDVKRRREAKREQEADQGATGMEGCLEMFRGLRLSEEPAQGTSDRTLRRIQLTQVVPPQARWLDDSLPGTPPARDLSTIPETPTPEEVNAIRRGSASTSLDEDVLMQGPVMAPRVEEGPEGTEWETDRVSVDRRPVERGESLELVEAKALGMDEMRVPAPVLNKEVFTGATPWQNVWDAEVKRFNPGITDIDVLVNKGVPAERYLKTWAPVLVRSLYDPMAGLPVGRMTFDGPPTAWIQIDEESEESFENYAKEFDHMMAFVNAYREEWLKKVPPGDPLFYDEMAFRSLENVVLQ